MSTKAVFVTPGGMIDGPGAYVPEQPDSYALNLERRVLDPALRAAARQHGVRYIDAKKISLTTWQAALTPAGGEVLGNDW